MESLKIKSVSSIYKSPEVHLDVQTGLCEFKGESYVEDTWGFYEPILGWIAEYIKTIKGPLDVVFKLHYYNTSSSKLIQNILKIIKDYSLQQSHIKIAWYYDPDDDSTLEDGEDFKRYLGLDMMELIPFEH